MTELEPSVLVLGGTGMLGHVTVAEFVAAGFDVHASVRDRSLAARLDPAANLHDFDAVQDSAAVLLQSVAPAVVINCIGVVKQLEAASKPLPAIRLNALFPHEMAAACEEVGARLIHISTDCVFSGRLPLGSAYTEEDEPDAQDLYGLTKRLGELHSPGSLTLRTSIIGWELDRSTGLLEWFARQNGGRVDGYTQAIFSGLTTRALARIITRLATDEPQLSGLYHLSSEPIAKYDLLQQLRDALELDIEISPVDTPQINRALNSDRLREAAGISIPSWSQMLSEYKRESLLR